MSRARRVIFTVGHSTHPWEEFVSMLRAHGVATIADVRRYPGSRKHPQYGAAVMTGALAAEGIGYLPLPTLGGRRRPRVDSPNTAWRSESFRGYADYMASEEFAAGLAELEAVAGRQVTAIMCAEAVPWRCHRSLIADALIARGWVVYDIMSATSAPVHKLTPFAKIRGRRVTYPGEAGEKGSRVEKGAGRRSRPRGRESAAKGA